MKNQPYMKYIICLLFTGLLAGCNQTAPRSDAYGNFEATTTTVSAQANGQLVFLRVAEGQPVAANTLVALVDTTLLHLQRRQILAAINTLPQKLRTALADIRVLEDQKRNLQRERDRVSRLVDSKAATPKQLDDLNGELVVLDQRMAAIREQTATANRGIMAEQEPLLAQVALLDEQIRQAYVFNPVAGTVLTKLAEPAEVVGMGAPLYRIAQLDTLTLRAYVGSVPLQDLRLGQTVTVVTDAGTDGSKNYEGRITWISDQAEFTPKSIQTKADRVNLVYAVKIAVPNPTGQLKIGMPAEVNF
ncbi:MAG: HlyD family secretion protein [Bacteroidetes bacterium]|nr:MAG: HlyD family secretion protein [Bacteroidota bacterium]